MRVSKLSGVFVWYGHTISKCFWNLACAFNLNDLVKFITVHLATLSYYFRGNLPRSRWKHEGYGGGEARRCQTSQAGLEDGSGGAEETAGQGPRLPVHRVWSQWTFQLCFHVSPGTQFSRFKVSFVLLKFEPLVGIVSSHSFASLLNHWN